MISKTAVSQLARRPPLQIKVKATINLPFRPRCVLLMKECMWSPALSQQQRLHRRVGLPPPLLLSDANAAQLAASAAAS